MTTATTPLPSADDPATDGTLPPPLRVDPLVPIPTPRARLRAALLRRRLPWLLGLVEGGRLEVRLPDGSLLHGGDGDPGDPGVLRGQIEVVDSRCFEQVGARGQRGFGEAYVLGWWTSPDPAAALEVIARSASAASHRFPFRWVRLAQRLRPTWQRRNPPRSAKQFIAYHYDLGNDFFETFLDTSMTYSCATFEDPEDAQLHEAQVAKYDGICRQLDLGPDDHVLEIGCGWGGFAEHAATHYGARVTGVTISERQHEYARERIERAGLSELVDLRLQDYRHVTGTFDKIVSIEMLEAVGAREYGRFFRTVEERLAPDGLALVQVIGFQDRDYHRQLRSKGWIRRYVFPGGMLPSVNVLSRTMTRVSRLQVHGLREIGQHYGPTLRHWRERLGTSSEQLEQRGYGARLRRSWEYYFAICEAGFRSGHIRTMQLLIARSGTVTQRP